MWTSSPSILPSPQYRDGHEPRVYCGCAIKQRRRGVDAHAGIVTCHESVRTAGSPRRCGTTVALVPQHSRACAGTAREKDVESLPCPRESGCPRARRLRARRCRVGRPRRPHRGRRRHVHLRGPGRRDTAATGLRPWWFRNSRPSPSAAPSPGSESSRRRSATVCPTNRCSRWTSSPAPARSSPRRPDGEHADLFCGFPNSYGTLGYATRLRIELEPVKPYVALRHLRFDSTRRAAGSASTAIVADREYDGVARRLPRRRRLLRRPRAT